MHPVKMKIKIVKVHQTFIPRLTPGYYVKDQGNNVVAYFNHAFSIVSDAKVTVSDQFLSTGKISYRKMTL